MPYLSNRCISTISAPDFVSGSFYISAQPVQSALNFLLTWDPTGLCSHTGSIDYPAAVTLSSQSGLSITCDSITYGEISDPSGRLIVGCPLASPLVAGDIETLTLAITGNYGGRQTNSFTAVMTVEDPSTACAQSLTVTKPPDNVYYSTGDQGYIGFSFGYRPVDCAVTSTGEFDISITDPSANV